MMQVDKQVCFGDIDDMKRGNKPPVHSTGGTIIYVLDTCREFMPGTYNLHKIRENVILFCLEGISVNKVDAYFTNSDVGVAFKEKNFINRYDWMHFRNWCGSCDEKEEEEGDESEEVGLEDERKKVKKCLESKLKQEIGKRVFSYCFICTEPNLLFTLQAGDVKISEINQKMFTLHCKDTLFSFVCDIDRDGDWNYGALLQDKTSRKHFAFVFQDFYTNKACENDNITHKFGEAVDINAFKL